MNKHRILVVDDSITCLAAAKHVLSPEFEVLAVESGEQAIRLLENMSVHLILLDITMKGISGMDTLRYIKLDPKTKDIPVIFLTSITDTQNELLGLELGAVDYIYKPFTPPLLLKRLKMHLEYHAYTHSLEEVVTQKTKSIQTLQQAIVFTITSLIDRRDGSTGGHVSRTQLYMEILLDALLTSGTCQTEELENYDSEMIVRASQLHDLGKIGIPDYILLKPGRLTSDEYNMMKKHVTIGVEALQATAVRTDEKDFLHCAITLAGNHHERWDGTGYPHGKAGTEIPLLGRVLALADVYDALTSERPYKDAYTHDIALSIIQEEAGHQFDPGLVPVFMQAEKRMEAVSSMSVLNPVKMKAVPYF